MSQTNASPTLDTYPFILLPPRDQVQITGRCSLKALQNPTIPYVTDSTAYFSPREEFSQNEEDYADTGFSTSELGRWQRIAERAQAA